MRRLRSWMLRFASLLGTGRRDVEIVEELRTHRDLLTAEYVRSGMAPEHARRRAAVEFGSVPAVADAYRDRRGIPWLQCAATDARLALRSFRRAKGLAAAAIITFALGIGANIAVFSMFDRLLFRPLPYAAPDRLVHLHSFLSPGPDAAVLPGEVTLALAEEKDLFAGIAWAEGGVSNTVPAAGETPLSLTPVTANLLDVLGVAPALGRGFLDADGRSSAVEVAVLLTHETWQRRYLGSTAVLSMVWKDARSVFRVVGVLPPGFLVPSSRLAAAHYDGVRAISVNPTVLMRPGQHIIAPFARLAPGVSLQSAQARLDTIVPQRFADVRWGRAQENPRVVVQPLQSGMAIMVRSSLWLVVGSVWSILGVTCFSLAILLATWGRSRRRDAGLRLALGASPTRLVTGALWESLIVCVAGGTLGWLGYLLARTTLIGIVPPTLRVFAVEPTDSRVIVATLTAACVGAAIAGALPALGALRADILTVLHPERGQTIRGSLRSGRSLLTVQATFVLLLVVGASATVPGFIKMLWLSSSFNITDLFVADVQHNWSSDESLSSPEGMARVRTTLDLIGGSPGTADVAVAATDAFVTGRSSDGAFWRQQGLEGRDWAVSAAFFRTVQVPLLAGRGFTEGNIRDRALLAVVNEAGARALWPGTHPRDALGRTLTTADGTRVVIGVVRDFRSHPDLSVAPDLFIPLTAEEVPAVQNHLMVLMRMSPGRVPDVPWMIDRLNDAFPPNRVAVTSIAAAHAPALEQPRFLAVLFGTLAGIALFLTAVSLHGLSTFEVFQRRREMGIRLALGATVRDLRRHVVRVVVGPVVVGIVIGLPISWWSGRVLAGRVAMLDAVAVPVYATAVLAMFAVAFTAAWLPARRLRSMKPSDVLRSS